MGLILFSARENDEVVDENQTNIDLEQDRNKGQPVDILSVELDKILLVSIFFLFVIIAILRPSKRALDLRFKNEGPSWEDITIKGHNFDEKPAVDAC